MTGLRAGRLRNVDSITGRGSISLLQKVQTLSGVHSVSCAMVTGCFLFGGKAPEREADQCPPSGAEVNIQGYS